jgi:hypothetical protein
MPMVLPPSCLTFSITRQTKYLAKARRNIEVNVDDGDVSSKERQPQRISPAHAASPSRGNRYVSPELVHFTFLVMEQRCDIP